MAIFYSHFEAENSANNKLLVDHLQETGAAARSYILAVPDSVKSKDELAELTYWTGILHDFGKFTSFFQSYLTRGVDSGTKKNHSLIGALWAMAVLQEKWQGKKIDSATAMFLSFSAIRSHHGDLTNLADELKSFLDFLNPLTRKMMDPPKRRPLTILFEEHLPDLRKHSDEIEKELQKKGFQFPQILAVCQMLEDDQSHFWLKFQEAALTYKKWQSQKAMADFNALLYLLFSALIDADKRDAAQVQKRIKRHSIPADIVKQFKKKAKFGSAQPDLIKLRETIFQQLDKKANFLDLERHIFTLTAPTGSGKTLAAFNFAMQLRERIYREKGFLPRIVYALPFTSIIDQNYNVINSILSLQENHAENPAARILKHHHLAELKAIHFGKADDYPLDKLLLLVESWESEIIVTTFVQFFETLISRRNKMLKKYHNLYGAIVLLDEVQNIPIEYWSLVRRVLEDMAQKADCYVVLMTATQPLIFPENDALELVENREEIFSSLNRVKFFYDPAKLKIEEFLEEAVSLPNNKSAAMIVNTIGSSLELFRGLTEADTESIYYLSTNILPKQRLQRIKEIREKLKRREPVRLVSTQVIEAGVDLDFDIVYRDLAPIDSIVQSAGRANRNGLEKRGEVRVISLINENGKSFAQWIYGSGHLKVADDLLKSQPEINENDFYRLVQENYAKLAEIYDDARKEELYEKWMLRGDFSALKDFRLISGKFDYADIFVEVDEEAEKIWQYYMQNVFYEKDISSRRNAYLKIRADFRNHVISMPAKYVKKRFWDYCVGRFDKIGYIPRDEIEFYYDQETGFLREASNETMIF